MTSKIDTRQPFNNNRRPAAKHSVVRGVQEKPLTDYFIQILPIRILLFYYSYLPRSLPLLDTYLSASHFGIVAWMPFAYTIVVPVVGTMIVWIFRIAVTTKVIHATKSAISLTSQYVDIVWHFRSPGPRGLRYASPRGDDFLLKVDVYL